MPDERRGRGHEGEAAAPAAAEIFEVEHVDGLGAAVTSAPLKKVARVAVGA